MSFKKYHVNRVTDIKAVSETNIKPNADTFYKPDPEHSLSPPTAYHEMKESENVQYPQSTTVKNRRDSLSWTEQLTIDLVSDDIDSIAEEDEEETDNLGTGEAGEIDVTLQDLQFGIRKSLEKLPNPDRDLLMTDFSMIEEMNFSKNSPTETNFLLRVYAPVAFRYFRELFGITSDDFIYSVCDAPLHTVSTNSHSGSAFFTTRDDRFILKTVPKKEAQFLRALFPGYFLNLNQHKKTLLPKYYGLFCYVRGVKTIRVLIMNNILPTSCNFYHKYDLKGSTYSKRKQLKHKEIGPSKVILKDLDFMENFPEGFYLPQDIHKLLLKSIERDCQVLESYNIMDYSLLLGIVVPEDPSSPVRPSKRESFSYTLKKQKNLIGPFVARTPTRESVFLFMGIIDILQSYNWKKKLECHFKSLFYSRSTISVNSPDFYSNRFQEFLRCHVFRYSPALSREFSTNVRKPRSSNAANKDK